MFPTWETSLGYQVLNAPDQTFPLGIAVDGARNFGKFGLAAELGWAFSSDDGDDLFDEDVNTNVFHGGIGPRFTGRNQSRVWPFAQALAGFAYARSSVEVGGIDVSDSATHFMFQPGAGVVILGGDGWGFLAQADYRRVFLDEEEFGDSGENDFRIFFGVRVILD